MELKSECKLELFFKNLNLKNVASAINSKSNKGPNGYDPENIIRALLAQHIEKIPTCVALVSRLKSDPVFRFSCGFDVTGKIPSEATFSRYYNKLAKSDSLEKLFHQLVDEAVEEDVIDNETMAIDSTKFSSYENLVSKTKVDKENPLTPD